MNIVQFLVYVVLIAYVASSVPDMRSYTLRPYVSNLDYSYTPTGDFIVKNNISSPYPNSLQTQDGSPNAEVTLKAPIPMFAPFSISFTIQRKVNGTGNAPFSIELRKGSVTGGVLTTTSDSTHQLSYGVSNTDGVLTAVITYDEVSQQVKLNVGGVERSNTLKLFDAETAYFYITSNKGFLLGNMTVMSAYDSILIRKNATGSGVTWAQAQQECAKDNMVLASIHALSYPLSLFATSEKTWVGGLLIPGTVQPIWVDGSSNSLLPTQTTSSTLKCFSWTKTGTGLTSYTFTNEACTTNITRFLCQTKAVVVMQSSSSYSSAHDDALQKGLELAPVYNQKHLNMINLRIEIGNYWTGAHYRTGKLAFIDGTLINDIGLSVTGSTSNCVKFVGNGSWNGMGTLVASDCTVSATGYLAQRRYLTLYPTDGTFSKASADSTCASFGQRLLPILANSDQESTYCASNNGYPSYMAITRIGSSLLWRDGSSPGSNLADVGGDCAYFAGAGNWRSITCSNSSFGVIVCERKSCRNGWFDSSVETCDNSPYNDNLTSGCCIDCNMQNSCFGDDYYLYKTCANGCSSGLSCFDSTPFCTSYPNSCKCEISYVSPSGAKTYLCGSCSCTYNDCCGGVPSGKICPFWGATNVSRANGCCVCIESTVQTNMFPVASSIGTCYPSSDTGSKGFFTCGEETNEYCLCSGTSNNVLLPPAAVNCNSSLRVKACPQTTCPGSGVPVAVDPAIGAKGQCCPTYRCDMRISSGFIIKTPPPIPPFSVAPSSSSCYPSSTSVGVATCSSSGASFCACAASSPYLIPSGKCVSTGANFAGGVSIVPCKSLPAEFCIGGIISVTVPADPANGVCCPTYTCTGTGFKRNYDTAPNSRACEKTADIINNNNNNDGSQNNQQQESYKRADLIIMEEKMMKRVSTCLGTPVDASCVDSYAYYSCDNFATSFCSCTRFGETFIPQSKYAQCNSSKNVQRKPCEIPDSCPLDTVLQLVTNANPAAGVCCPTYKCQQFCEGPCSVDSDCVSPNTCVGGICSYNKCANGGSGCGESCQYLGGCKYRCLCGTGNLSDTSNDPFLVNLGVSQQAGSVAPATAYTCECPAGTVKSNLPNGNSTCVNFNECSACSSGSSSDICTRTPSLTFLHAFCHPSTTCTDASVPAPIISSEIYPMSYGFKCSQCSGTYVDVGLLYAQELNASGLIDVNYMDYVKGRNCACPSSACSPSNENALCYNGTVSAPTTFGICRSSKCIGCAGTDNVLTSDFCETTGKAFQLVSGVNPSAYCTIKTPNTKYCLCGDISGVSCTDGLVTCTGTCCTTYTAACNCDITGCKR